MSECEKLAQKYKGIIVLIVVSFIVEVVVGIVIELSLRQRHSLNDSQGLLLKAFSLWEIEFLSM